MFQRIDRVHFVATAIGFALLCGSGLAGEATNSTWTQSSHGDVVVISQGDRVALKDEITNKPFTVVAFVAPWSAACVPAWLRVDGYLAEHADVAVRVISLPAEDEEGSRALPVAQQYLQHVAGVPYFIVFDNVLRPVYVGHHAGEMLETMDEHRIRVARLDAESK